MFSEDSAKFLRIPFFIEHIWQLLLICDHSNSKYTMTPSDICLKSSPYKTSMMKRFLQK